MHVERGAALLEFGIDRVDGEHAAAAVEIRDIAGRQPIPGALRHALRQDGVEDRGCAPPTA